MDHPHPRVTYRSLGMGVMEIRLDGRPIGPPIPMRIDPNGHTQFYNDAVALHELFDLEWAD